MLVPARAMTRVLICIAFPAALAMLLSCTVVKRGAAGTTESAAQKAASNEEFDAKAFVKANWAGKIEPELVRDAVDVREVVAALKKDKDAAERKYGRRKDVTALYNFIVSGDEVIKSVNTESAAGYFELGLADISGEGGVEVQIGPVIKTSAVRDVLSFINFGDFVNQLDFANISREINFHVRDTIVSGLRKTELAGKHLSFVGAFAEDATGKVLITPVKIDVKQ